MIDLPPASSAVTPQHIAARIEDWVLRVREGRARARGLVPTVIPYTGYGSTTWIRVLCRVVLARPEHTGVPRAAKIRGWRSFFSIPVSTPTVTVRIGDRSFPADVTRGGVVDTTIACELEPGWHEIQITAPGSAPATAHVQVIDPHQRFGLVSDIDDTVMVTLLPRPLTAAWNTFVLDEQARRVVPGMAVLYDRFVHAHPGAPVIYLSTGAWNVAPTLRRFLGRHLYPSGPLLLTDWGPTHDRLFRSGREHKLVNLRRLMTEFPHIRWLLVGDDGQHDPDTYAEMSREYPHQVAAIAIRHLSTGEAVLGGPRARIDAIAEGSTVPWCFASNGSGLATELVAAGVLPRDSGPRRRVGATIAAAWRGLRRSP